MARKRILIDAGPLVAILAADDAHHNRCLAEAEKHQPPFFTTWAILTEVAWLLRAQSTSIPQLMALIARGLIVAENLGPGAASEIGELADAYADLRPDLGDLTLIQLVGNDDSTSIFTLDRRDFNVYRDRLGRPFPLIPESL
jgi:hypothetical protein